MVNIRPPAYRKLRTAFLLALAFTYSVISVVTFIVFFAAAGSLSDRYAERYGIAQSELEKSRIRSLLDRELVLSLKLADDPAIRRWIRAEDDAELKAAAVEQLESYRRLFRDASYFLAIASSGSYYVRASDSEELQKTTLKAESPDDRWFYTMLAGSGAYALNVDHNALLAENRVWINVIVRDAGKAIGIAGCGLDLTAFLSALLDRSEAGITTVIVDAEGTLLAYKDRDLVARNAEATNEDLKAEIYGLIPDAADRRSLRTALHSAGDGRPTVLRLKFQGMKQLCAVSSLPELGWYGLVFVDTGSVIGPADFIPIGAVNLLALLAVAAIMVALTNRSVLSPIAKLTEATSRIAGGSYEIVVPVGSDNEIGRLAASFQSMAEKIKEYTRGLEALVQERTVDLREANADLEASRRSILESIEYAKLIQDSINPSTAELDSRLGGWFAVVRERDLVGGDFFFLKATEDGFCIAVVDCTGHGVPGAFMTMLVKAHLDRVVESLPDASPAAMLAELDRLVGESLAKEAESAHLENGLDIAFCRYRASADTLSFAGAGLPLFFLRDEEVLELAASHAHLGFSAGRRKKELTNHVIATASRSRFYLATDGVLDLPGGSRGLAFGRTRLRRLIAAIAPLPFVDAESRSLEAFSVWQAGMNQRDDLTFIGFSLRSPKEA